MKSWNYYSTPTKHPWVGDEEIKKFEGTISGHPETTRKWIVTNFIWDSDDKTERELVALEWEFRDDACKELGISVEEYNELDPYGEIIGSPENHESPSPGEYKKMYEYLKEKIEA